MDSVEVIHDSILEVLEFSEEPVPTLKIARHVFGKGSSKKAVNRYLYALEKEGVLEKLCDDDGTKPRWTLKK